jgi:PBSX family phage terminase large subunit
MSAIYSPKQADVLLHADARLNILCGATASGKTFVARDLIPIRCATLGPGDIYLVGKTLGTLERNVLAPMRERFGSRYISDLHGGVVHWVSIFGRKCYALGANDEAARSKVQGASAVYINADEIGTWPESFWQMSLRALREPGACLDGSLNPEGPFHWFKTGVIDRAGELDLKHWHFNLDDNPFLPPEFVQAIRTEYTGVWYQRMILGLWVAAEGAVYGVFDTALHVVEPADLPGMTAHWVSCDYGTSNPTVFLLIGLGTDRCFYVIDEWRWDSEKTFRQMTDAQYARALQQFIDGHGVNPRRVIIDPSSASFRLQVFNDCPTLRPKLMPADNNVLDGIRRTASLIGLNRLKFSSRCKASIGEMTNYVWDANRQAHGEDVPVKTADHGPDCTRYFVNSTREIWEPWMRLREAA